MLKKLVSLLFCHTAYLSVILCLRVHILYSLSRFFRKIFKIHYQLRHVCLSVRPSDRIEQLAATGWIFMKYDIRVFSKHCLENSRFMNV